MHFAARVGSGARPQRIVAAKPERDDLTALHALTAAHTVKSWSHAGGLPSGERISHEVLANVVEDGRSLLLVVDLAGEVVGSAPVQDAAGADATLAC